MQCHEFEDRLNEVLDERGEPAADPQLRAHAGDCDSCRQRLAGQRLLLTGLRLADVPPLPADFSRHVVTAAAIPQPLARPRSSPRMLLAIGVLFTSAAAALLAISLAWYARSGSSIVADTPRAVPTIPAEPNVRPLSPRRNTTSGAFAMSQADVIYHLRGGIDELADAFPETVERYGEVERLATGIRPLRLSFVLFWDTLFRALPGVRGDSRPAPPADGTSSLVIDLMRMA
jgi:hypothetical protein